MAPVKRDTPGVKQTSLVSVVTVVTREDVLLNISDVLLKLIESMKRQSYNAAIIRNVIIIVVVVGLYGIDIALFCFAVESALGIFHSISVYR